MKSLFILMLFPSLVMAQVISPARQKAAMVYQRIAGVKISIDNPFLDQMESLISQGRDVEAAELVTERPEFLNITVKHMASRMSTRDETVNSPLSDFTATFIGAIRDNKDAKSLLTGDYYYRGDFANAAITQNNVVDDIVRSNDHYAEIENKNLDLATVLVEQPRQLTLDNNLAVTNLPDAGGLLTTRGFSEAHAVAGTNRRMVHYAFREFLCIDVAQWSDTSLPDTFVGRDVDRAPAGNPADYMTTCKGCHAPMDALRGAFAHMQFGEFNDGYVQHGTVQTRGTGSNRFRSTAAFPQIAEKYYRNADTYPTGYNTTDASWVNNLNFGQNGEYFGWRNLNAQRSGTGVKQFGKMIADSEGFSRCMVKRVYRAACKRETTDFENTFVKNTAVEFEKTYSFKKLFALVATSPECIGQ